MPVRRALVRFVRLDERRVVVRLRAPVLRPPVLRPVVFRPVVLRAAVRFRLGLRRAVVLLDVRRFRAAGLRVEAFRVVWRRAGRASGIGSEGIPIPIGSSCGCPGIIGVSSVTLVRDLPFELSHRVSRSCPLWHIAFPTHTQVRTFISSRARDRPATCAERG